MVPTLCRVRRRFRFLPLPPLSALPKKPNVTPWRLNASSSHPGANLAYVTARINGARKLALVDSASSLDLISSSFAQSTHLAVKTPSAGEKLSFVDVELPNGQSLRAEGYVDVQITLSDFTTTHRFYVLPINIPLILGQRFLDDHNCAYLAAERQLVVNHSKNTRAVVPFADGDTPLSLSCMPMREFERLLATHYNPDTDTMTGDYVVYHVHVKMLLDAPADGGGAPFSPPPPQTTATARPSRRSRKRVVFRPCPRHGRRRR